MSGTLRVSTPQGPVMGQQEAPAWPCPEDSQLPNREAQAGKGDEWMLQNTDLDLDTLSTGWL